MLGLLVFNLMGIYSQDLLAYKAARFALIKSSTLCCYLVVT